METIKNELAVLVYTYSANKKIADKSFADKVIELYRDAIKVNDYVKDYKYVNYDIAGAVAVYDICNKEVLLNVEGIIDTARERLQIDEQLGIITSEFNYYAKINLTVVNAIIHELTHASQYKRYIEGPKDLENEILGLSLERNVDVLKKNYISPQKAFYYKMLDRKFREELYHDALPSERMADIKGLEFENDISKLLKSEDKDALEKYTTLRLLHGKITGYKGFSPTGFVTLVNETLKLQFGLNYGESDIEQIESRYNLIAKEYNLDTEERIRLGLPVEKIELQKIKTKADILKEVI